MTEQERAEALARYRATLDARPPTDEEAERFYQPSRAARLRTARDDARATLMAPDLPEKDTSGGYGPGTPGVPCSLGEMNNSAQGRGGQVTRP